jgi:hypothetical protein
MPLLIRQSKTATGKLELIVGAECSWEEFPGRAQEIVDQFQLLVAKRIDGFDERMWIAYTEGATFCISWDVWTREVSIMAWEQTPDEAVAKLFGC